MNEDFRDRLGAIVSQIAIANDLGIVQQAVNRWFSKFAIPPCFVLSICVLADWKVTPHEVSPELYPSPDDGLPNFLRRIRQAGQNEV